jgi:hypothetical protein
MTRGKYRKKKQHKREANLARSRIVNPTNQQPDPAAMADQRKPKPDCTKPTRLPSTIGEIVMAVFVGVTALIYIILTYVSVKTLHVDQRAWLSTHQGHIVRFEEGSPFQLSQPFLNTGKTPALNITEAVNYEVEDRRIPGPTKEMVSTLDFSKHGSL